MNRLALGLSAAWLALWAFTAHASGGVNLPRHQGGPSVVLVSIDGMRWDFPDLHDLPATRETMRRGFRAERLIPVFPTVTFPNHYSIATGLYPDRHGLVGNEFYAPELDRWYALRDRETVGDGRFYGGEPIWVTAERRGMVSAACFFVGTEADIGGVRPSHWKRYDKSLPADDRVDQVLAWLALPPETRPRLITLYFEDVDSHSHWKGLGTEAFRSALDRVDQALGRLISGIAALPATVDVNVVVVSDHGASGYLADSPALVLEDHVDLAGIRNVGEGAFTMMYFDAAEKARVDEVRATLEAAWDHGRVFSPADAPSPWHIGDNPRWPDLIVMPDPGHGVISRAGQAHRMNPGDHGWAPELPDMHGVLFGFGPAFQPGTELGPVRVVDVYPLLTRLLGIEDAPEVDGRIEPFLPALRLPAPP